MNKSNNIWFSTKSMVDDFGRVFFCNEKIYRAIHTGSIDFCLELINSQLFVELSSEGLIPQTKISDFELEGYELILEHEKLSEIQQHEWSFEMLKKSSLVVLKINELCNKYGYELKDAHTFNVLFRGTNPVYADLGSIAKRKTNEWIAHKEFYCVFYLPLLFWSKQELYIVRKLVESNFYRMQTAPFQDMLDSKLISLIDENPYKYYLQFKDKLLFNSNTYYKYIKLLSRLINRILSVLSKKPIRLFTYEPYEFVIPPINDLKIKVENISQIKQQSEWDGYHQNNYSENNKFIPSKRFNRILDIVNELEPDIKSVIDLAGNEGLFTKLIADSTKIQNLKIVDYDSNAIDVAFKRFSLKQYDRVAVAVLNFIFTLDIESTAKRYKSDLVIALAVTHHLILTQNYSLEVIFERLCLFSNKYVLVEFMPLGLWSIHTKQGVTPPDWYTFDWFKLKFENYFDIITIETLEENRILFVGKKLSNY